MKKKVVAMLLTGVMVCSMTACGEKNDTPAPTDNKNNTEVKEDVNKDTDNNKEEISLSVSTTFAGTDSNAKNYKDGVAAFEKDTGIKIKDSSQTSDETFKARIEADFQTGSEPDVLFYFTGADANSFIEEGKVVPLEEIRAEYPEYAANMDDAKLVPSLVDGKLYTVSTNGYWEAMYVNKGVLADCGVEIPGPDYSWEQFMNDCAKIKEKGYTPVAAALGEIPHYWWEFSIFNNAPALDKHAVVPTTMDEAAHWVAGMEDVKAMYEAGCFPENTLTAKDDETFQLFMNNKAAFLVDGSWKTGGITAACQSDENDPSTLDTEKLANFTVTYVPAKGARKASDLIGGYSMGYYITRKAWDDEAKRDAAVRFVEAMTTDDMIFKFALIGSNPLKEAPVVNESELNSLQQDDLKMVAGATSWTPAVQDLFNGECRVPTFDGMPAIVSGEVSAADAVEEGLNIYASQAE